MKYLFFLFVFTSSISLAQNGINYQGAATDSDGNRLANQNISLRTSVLQGGIDGTNSYSETHNTITDQFGLFNVVVGQGEVVSGDFEGISWGTDAHFLKVELDATGGTNYSVVSTTQMMSVPYALYAKNAGLDSLAITSMLESMNFSVNNNRSCDYIFPDGLDGQGIAWDFNENGDYTVPAGKNLYITNVFTYDGYSFRINGMRIMQEMWGVEDEFAQKGMLKLPLYAKAGDIVSNSNNGNVNTFYGILVNKIVEPITYEFYDLGTGFENHYTVPSGKKLVIMNIWAYGGQTYYSKLKIDGVEIAEESFNVAGPYEGKQLYIPLIVNSGSTVYIETSYSSFNGYLVDEDYFADCGGGSTNSSSSEVDSAMVAEMIANSGNGCDFKFPEGIGTPVSKSLQGSSTYTVPENKRLYITNEYSSQNGIRLNGEFLYFNNNNNPITVNAGDVIGTYGNNSSHVVQFNGFLVDTTENLSVINKNLQAGMTYTVPENKRLYITNHYSSQNGIRLNGEFLYFSDINNPIMLSGGDVIGTYGNNSSHVVQFNGFLVDTNYFDNCNTLLSNSNSGGNSNVQITVSQFGDTLYGLGNDFLIIPGISAANQHLQFSEYEFGSVTDIDGNTYKTLVYGENEWMVENLRTNTGDFITGTSAGFEYNDSIGNYYSYSTVQSEICPDGWHVSTIEDWLNLHYVIFASEMNPNGYTDIQNGYNENNYSALWSTFHIGGTNQSKFNLFETGWYDDGLTDAGQYSCHFITSTMCEGESCPEGPGLRRVNIIVSNNYNDFELDVGGVSNSSYSQIRCVKD